MRIQALRFTEHGQAVHSTLHVESSDALKAAVPVGPVAYVVRDRDLQHLRELDDVVVDRRTKHNARPLAKILLGSKKMPLVNGTYAYPGRAVQGVRKFLVRAVQRGDHNVYFVGTTDAIFQKLWDQAGRGTGSASEELLGLLPPSRASKDVSRKLAGRYIGASVETERVREQILRAALEYDGPVLILGDTGTGKDVVARCIAEYSGRRPLVTVVCGAFPSDLLESVLFGNVRGAFTSAVERDGLWKRAGNGTLFLDEIGDLQLHHQAKILRALQEKKIRPVGGDEIDAPARVIAATNRDLYAMVKAGQFREDLYYRLRYFTIRTPALRQHAEDVPRLAEFFWRDITKDERATLPAGILAELRRYTWPGNARELKAVLSALHALFGAENLRVDHLRWVFRDQGQTPEVGPAVPAEPKLSQRRVESLRHLRRVEEVIQTAEVTLRPFLRAKAHDAATVDALHRSLQYRLNELSLLCLHEPLFRSHATFTAVTRLQEQLAQFDRLLRTEVKEALRRWKEVGRDFKQASAAVIEEVDRVTAGR